MTRKPQISVLAVPVPPRLLARANQVWAECGPEVASQVREALVAWHDQYDREHQRTLHDRDDGPPKPTHRS